MTKPEFEPLLLHRGAADWGLPMTHVITRQGSSLFDQRSHAYGQSFSDSQSIIAEIPSIQPYCMGASRADLEYAQTQLAYATLFTAAPVLLAALEEVLGWHDDADNLHKPIEVRAAYQRARAAVAQAYGKESN